MTGPALPVVLVTGAGGFIGSALCQALAEAGFSVKAGVRRGAGVACDLDRPEQVAAAMAGVGLVIHAAYGDSAAMARQCETLLAAMAATGVDSLIHFSSIAVYGAAAGTIVENRPLGPALDAYGSAKIACEGRVRAWAEAPEHPGRRGLILRPGIVYGKGSPFWIEKMGERIRRGAWGTFGASGEGAAALVHVADVAALVVAAARAMSGAQRETLPVLAAVNVAGPELPSWNDYFTALAARLGVSALPVLDGAVLKRRQGLALAAKVWRKLGLPGGEGLALAATPGEVALFARRADYRSDAAERLYGVAPRIGLAEGLGLSLPQAKS